MDGDPLPLPVVSIGHRGDCVDGDTLARAQAGEVDAFRQLIRTHQGAVYSLAARLVGIREDAQELTQDVFLQLHRNLASIESPSHLRFWLRKTACHRSIDRLRKQTRQPSTSLEAAVE